MVFYPLGRALGGPGCSVHDFSDSFNGVHSEKIYQSSSFIRNFRKYFFFWLCLGIPLQLFRKPINMHVM